MSEASSGSLSRSPAAGYTVRVPGFEGPLDLLVTLAHQGKVDLAVLPLADLAREFLDRSRHQLDLDEATEALWMLAALVEMKARLLLPKAPPPEAAPEPESGSDLADRLEAQLDAYRGFKEAAEALRALEEFQRRVFVRPPQAPEAPPLLLDGLTVHDLFAAFQTVLTRVRQARTAEVAVEPVRVADRRAALLEALRASPEGVEFSALFPRDVTVVFIVVTFLALLDLIKDRQVWVEQPGPLAPIRVRLA